MTTLAEDEELRRKLLAAAEEHGAAVVHVAEEDGQPPYAFSVGAWRQLGIPEVIVIGLAPQVAQAVVDTYVDRCRAGERFTPGQLYDGFLQECRVTFERVLDRYYPEWFGHAFLVYRAGTFPALQLVVPTPDGAWPWQPDAPPGFDTWQPLLTASGGPESWTPGVDGP